MAEPYGINKPESSGLTDPEYISDPSEAQTPGDANSDDEQFIIFKRWWQEARDKSRKWREEATEDFGFVAGHQWKPEDESYLKEQLRPVVTYNYIGIMIDAVSGMEVTNRQEVRYIPRQMGDVGVNELLTAAAKWFRDESRAEESETDGFRDTAICGMGWIDTRLDYEDNPDGTAATERVDPLEMYWDPNAKKRNLKDRRYQIRAKQMPLVQAREMFPDASDADLDAGWAMDAQSRREDPHEATEAKFYRNDQSGREGAGSRRLVTILEFQWWDRETYIRIKDPQTSELKSFDLETGQKLVKFAKTQGIRLESVKGKHKVFKRAFVGGIILESGPSPYPKGFTKNPITAKRDRNKNEWYGLVRVMKDPQRWANKYLSTLQHYISTTGRGILAEKGVFVNQRKAEEEWSKADSITEVQAGAISSGKIAGKPGGQIPQEVMGLMEFSIASFPKLTGLNPELLGMVEREQPGILEYQRKQAGMTILAPLFDGLRQYRKVQGEVLLYYIQNYFTDGRLIRIDGEEGKKYIPLIRDACLGEYEVIIDQATSSINEKEQTWGTMQTLLPLIADKLPPTFMVDLIPYLPLPNSLTEKWKEKAAQLASQPPPPPQPIPANQAQMITAQAHMVRAQAQSQIEPMKLQLETEKVKATIENQKANAIAALIKAGVQMSEPQLAVFQQELEALTGQQSQMLDHRHKLIQNAQQHQQAMVQAQQTHQHTLAQQEQQAALEPEPTVQ